MLEHLQKRGGTVLLWNLLFNQTGPTVDCFATRFPLKKPPICSYILFTLTQLMSIDLPFFEKFSMVSRSFVDD